MQWGVHLSDLYECMVLVYGIWPFGLNLELKVKLTLYCTDMLYICKKTSTLSKNVVICCCCEQWTWWERNWGTPYCNCQWFVAKWVLAHRYLCHFHTTTSTIAFLCILFSVHLSFSPCTRIVSELLITGVSVKLIIYLA